MGEPARRLATWPIRVRPDWDCEILSPSNRWRDRGRKADLAFEARDGAWVRLGAWTEGDTPRVPPFDAIELDVGGLFPPLG